MYDSDTFFDGKTAMLAGWGGTTTRGYEMSNELKETPVLLLETKTCERDTDYPKNFFTKPRNFGPKLCGETPFAAVCYGDSGGPLVVDIKKGKGHKYVLVGTVSGGLPGKECDAPGHYQRVGSYEQWIKWYTEETNNVQWVKLRKDDFESSTATQTQVGSTVAQDYSHIANIALLSGIAGIGGYIVGTVLHKKKYEILSEQDNNIELLHYQSA